MANLKWIKFRLAPTRDPYWMGRWEVTGIRQDDSPVMAVYPINQHDTPEKLRIDLQNLVNTFEYLAEYREIRSS